MAMKARYTVIDGEIIAEKRNGVRRLYVPDPLGSTVALVDNTQTQTDTFGYWPYGENNGRTGTTPTPFQFVGTAGYYRDSNTRDYVRARVLDTAKGRWLTNDSVGFDGGDFNLYRYIANRATSVTDPSGTKYVPPFPSKRECARNWPRDRIKCFNCCVDLFLWWVRFCTGFNNKPDSQKICDYFGSDQHDQCINLCNNANRCGEVSMYVELDYLTQRRTSSSIIDGPRKYPDLASHRHK